MTAGLGFTFVGGNATSQETSNAGGALNLNFNPAFQVGDGYLSDSVTASPTSSSSPTAAPSLVAATNQGVPGTTTPAATPASSSISPEYIWLGLGLIVLVMLMPSGSGKRR